MEKEEEPEEEVSVIEVPKEVATEVAEVAEAAEVAVEVVPQAEVVQDKMIKTGHHSPSSEDLLSTT